MVNSDLFHFFRNYLSAPGQGPHTEVIQRCQAINRAIALLPISYYQQIEIFFCFLKNRTLIT